MEKSITSKIYWLFGACICFCTILSFVFSKTPNIDKQEIKAEVSRQIKLSNQSYQPRMRVSRSASLTLSVTWQKIDFSGSSSYNVNTFQPDPNGSGNPLVYWDATNKIFKFYNTVDLNYETLFTGASSATLLSTPVDIRLRITIPNGAGAGVDIHIPNPDADGYVDLGTASFIAHRDYAMALPAYINQAVRTNGFFVEACISNTSLGTITLDNSAFLIQATNSIN